MPSLPDGWGLKARPRDDGRLDIVGKDDTGQEYVAHKTAGMGVTERDLQILDMGNRETHSAKEVVDFYQKQRDDVNKAKEYDLAQYCEAGAEKVVHAGLHLSESRVGYSRTYAQRWASVFGEEK